MRNMEYIMHGLSTGMRSGVIKKKTVWKMLRKTRKRFSRECILEKKHLCSTGSERHLATEITGRLPKSWKLYAETLEGCIRVKAENAKLEVLNPIGEVIAEMNGEKTGDEIRFAMDGSVPGIQYRLVVGE